MLNDKYFQTNKKQQKYKQALFSFFPFEPNQMGKLMILWF